MRFCVIPAVAFLTITLPLAPALAEESAVSLVTLLKEMVDRDSPARWPCPEYVARMTSSYDRRSDTPQDARGWFANTDNMDQPVTAWKVENRAGRYEWVLLESAGPGAIVRFWTGGSPPVGTVRFYLDGAEEPAIAERLGDLLGGRSFVPRPLAIENSGAATNLYLPIPYARSCKITYEQGAKDDKTRPPGRWYNIEYRVYPAETKVETFSRSAYDAARALVDQVAATLSAPQASEGGKSVTLDQTIAAGGQAAIDLPAGPGAVRQITVRLPGARTGAELQALRSLVLQATFDGQQTIWCPLGEFFGVGVTLLPLNSWARSVGEDGTLTCCWVMPYRESARLVVENLSGQAATVQAEVRVGDWKWDDRSMHFRSNWRQQYPIHTRPFVDWNYLTAAGKGVYVGDTLAIFNPTRIWWGEGDEKVWVDDEAFPSHFGTGTEDHYGYAWGHATRFQGPFCNQPTGTGDVGHRTNTRIRALDAIPFTRSLKYDMEIWHWAECDVAYAVATYWYALPGATTTIQPMPLAAAAPLQEGAVRIKGAVECETMKVLACSEGLKHSTQQRYPFPQGQWSDEGQLFVQAANVGDFIELLVADNVAGPRTVALYATKSYDYGVLRLSVNGRQVDKDFDGYHDKPVLTGALELGQFEPKDGKLVLRAEVVGSNPESKGPKHYFGLDCVVLTGP